MKILIELSGWTIIEIEQPNDVWVGHQCSFNTKLLLERYSWHPGENPEVCLYCRDEVPADVQALAILYGYGLSFKGR